MYETQFRTTCAKKIVKRAFQLNLNSQLKLNLTYKSEQEQVIQYVPCSGRRFIFMNDLHVQMRCRSIFLLTFANKLLLYGINHYYNVLLTCVALLCSGAVPYQHPLEQNGTLPVHYHPVLSDPALLRQRRKKLVIILSIF